MIWTTLKPQIIFSTRAIKKVLGSESRKINNVIVFTIAMIKLTHLKPSTLIPPRTQSMTTTPKAKQPVKSLSLLKIWMKPHNSGLRDSKTKKINKDKFSMKKNKNRWRSLMT